MLKKALPDKLDDVREASHTSHLPGEDLEVKLKAVDHDIIA